PLGAENAGGAGAAAPTGDAGMPSGGAAALGFVDDFATNSGLWQPETHLAGAATAVGEPSAAALDGFVAGLRFPGHPEFASGDRVGPDYLTQLGTRERFHFGTYRTRVGFGACAPTEDAVMAFLGYFNDGQDHDGEGIVDDLEIDMQVTCGAPQRIYLTVF